MEPQRQRDIELHGGSTGRVYWFTGLSGSGKSTLGRAFVRRLRAEGRSVVYLDGDELRSVWGHSIGFSPKERRKIACSYSKLCLLLAEQGHDVVCATISLFHDVQAWNRQHIENYSEIVIRAPLETLRARKRDHLYPGENPPQIENVVGVDISPEFPRDPELSVSNDGTRSIDCLVTEIWLGLSPTEGG